MFELKTKAFSLTGNTITNVVEQWMRQRTLANSYDDLLILSIEPVTVAIEEIEAIEKKEESNASAM